MSKVTVKILREALLNLPDDLVVVMAKDAEGNGFAEVADIDTENNTYDGQAYDAQIGIKELTPQLKDRGFEAEDVLVGEDCIILWPVN